MSSKTRTNDNYIPHVIGRRPCRRHGARLEEACWNLFTVGGDLLLGICNARAVEAGYNAKVSHTSLTSRRFDKK